MVKPRNWRSEGWRCQESWTAARTHPVVTVPIVPNGRDGQCTGPGVQKVRVWLCFGSDEFPFLQGASDISATHWGARLLVPWVS